MPYQNIKTNKSECGRIWSVAINRPKKMNAVSFETLAEIEDFIMNQVNPITSGARVVVLSGEGKHFTSGLDLSSAAQIGNIGGTQEGDEEDADLARKAIRIHEHVLMLQKHTSCVELCRVPVICAVSGYCIGAGIDLSSACDIRLCSKDSKFTIKEVDIGICADLGTIQRF